MAITVPVGMRTKLIIGRSPDAGWWAAWWRAPDRGPVTSGWEGWDDGPDAGVREPRRPPPSPLQGAAELPEPD